MRPGQTRVRSSPTLLTPTTRLVLYVAVTGAAVAAMFGLARLDGILTKSDLVEFIAASITALSFAITFALAVLAINAFANYREIEAFKLDAEHLRADLNERTVHADKMLSMLPWVIEAIIARISEISPPQDTDRDVFYFRILHGRLFMKLLLAKDPIEKLDICRDIIGSMEPDDFSEVFDETFLMLQQLRADRPMDRDLIDPILNEAKRLLLERPQDI